MTESSAGSSGFDPRFNPAFQPGYDPRLHGAPQPDSGSETLSADQRQNEQVADALPSVIAPPSTADLGPLVRPTLSASSRPEDEVDASPIRIREPFLIALWAVSAVFIVGGVGLLRYLTDRLNALTTSGGGDASDYSLLRTFEIGAPLLVVLGLATATGTLFLLAARRGRAA
jgi:hypothetical protein